MLFDSGILPPSRDKEQKGLINSEAIVARHWHRNTVNDILTDEVYTGDLVQGKTRTLNGKEVQIPRKEWVTVSGTHEPIIRRELFDEAQKILRRGADEIVSKRNPTVPYSTHLFKGKVFCGHCGYAMHRHRSKDVYWFNCQSQVKYSQNVCVQVSVKEEDLKAGAAVMLRKYAETLLGRRLNLCKKAMGAIPDEDSRKTELKKIRQESEKNRDYLKHLFERLMSGEINSGEFNRLKKDFEHKTAELTERALELETSARQITKRVKECWELADCVSSVQCKYDLTAELLESLVEKILVYHDKSFEIIWRFTVFCKIEI
jgi:hypothetical protein